MHPRAERRITTKRRELIERANKRILRQVASQLLVLANAKDESMYPSDVRLVELARRPPVSLADTRNQTLLVHTYRRRKCRRGVHH